MRKTVAVLGLSAAASGLVLTGTANAATRTALGPADLRFLPGYVCLFRGPAIDIFPPIIHGRLCAAVGGAPEGGFVRGLVRISIRHERETWICRFVNAFDYPESVVGHDCFPRERERGVLDTAEVG